MTPQALDTCTEAERELHVSAALLQSLLSDSCIGPDARCRLSSALSSITSAAHRLARRSGPFATLPFDVLAEIFKLWAAADARPQRSDPEDLLMPTERVLPAVFAAAAVCRHWRATALACASLWTNIILDLRRATPELRRYIDLMLPRARARALYVRLDYVGVWASDSDACLDSDILVGVISRARTLDIHWQMPPECLPLDPHFEEPVLSLLVAPAPLLDAVTFDGLVVSDDIMHAANGAQILTLCPRLRALDLHRIPFCLLDPSTLTCVEVFSTALELTGAQLLRMAAAWPRLHTLTVSHIVAPVPVELHALRTLRNLDASIFACFHPPGSFPGLETVEICNSTRAFDALAAFLEGKIIWPSIKTLSIVAADWSTPQTTPIASFLGLMHNFPNAHTLSLQGFTTSVLRDLYRVWAQQPYLAGVVEVLQHSQCRFCVTAATALFCFLEVRNREEAEWERVKTVEVRQKGEGEHDRCVFPAWMQPRLQQLVDLVMIDSAGHRGLNQFSTF